MPTQPWEEEFDKLNTKKLWTPSLIADDIKQFISQLIASERADERAKLLEEIEIKMVEELPEFNNYGQNFTDEWYNGFNNCLLKVLKKIESLFNSMK